MAMDLDNTAHLIVDQELIPAEMHAERHPQDRFNLSHRPWAAPSRLAG